jgi:hypothetical protein
MAALTYGDLNKAPAGAFILGLDGEHYSATRGDYWYMADDDEVEIDDAPALLCVARTEYIVLAGEDDEEETA